MKLPSREESVRTARFLSSLYLTKCYLQYAGRVRANPLARAWISPWHANPYPQYERIRAEGPIARGIAKGVYTTADHDICRQVLTSRSFGTVGRDDNSPFGRVVDLSLLEMDPPDHTRVRRVAAPAFTPRRMAAYEARIEALAREFVDRAIAAGSFDLQKLIAAPLPIAVISQLLGVDEVDDAAFVRYGKALGGLLDGPQSLRHVREATTAREALRGMFAPLIAQRRTDPREDMLTTIAQHEGDTISADEMMPLCTLLLIAGFETTVNLVGNAVHQLMRHRDQWDRLVEDPALAAGAVEETLRFDPPVQLTSRVAHEDVEVGGRLLRKGSWVIPILAAAGRDPKVFDQPDRYDITRADASNHLAFSSGIHYCVGSSLARLEATIVLRVIAERMPTLRLNGKAPIRPSRVIRGVRRLPVTVEASRPPASPVSAETRGQFIN